MNQWSKKGIRYLFSALLFAMAIFCFSFEASSADKFWIEVNGYWSNDNAWDIPGAPLSEDLVYLTQDDDWNRTVWFDGEYVQGSSGRDDGVKIDATGSGTMALDLLGGTMHPERMQVGIRGTGTLSIFSGAHDFGSSGLQLGYEKSGNGVLNFYDGRLGTWDTGAWIGVYGKGLVNQYGGVWSTDESGINLGYYQDGEGNYNLHGGTVAAEYIRIGLRGKGSFNQKGGFVDPGNQISLASLQDSLGFYNMDDGSISANRIIVGSRGTGIFNQNGGDVGVSRLDSIVIGKESGSKGIYNLRDGTTRTWFLRIGVDGEGVLNQSGGAILPRDFSNVIIAQNDGSKGTYNLMGGSLKAGNMLNNGTFNYSGGEFSADIINNGTTTVSGNGFRTVNGKVENNGTVKVKRTMVSYTGEFTNNGEYTSHYSTQFFNDLIVSENGYITAKYGDRFFLRGNFENYSQMNFDWNTEHAHLSFLSGEDNIHDLYLTGRDYGNTMAGYSDNFAWGALDATDDILYLYDGNDEAGGSLYLRKIFGAEIVDEIVANISGSEGLTIYYNARANENMYLAGLDYNLSGSGYLRAVGSVPEPATMFLLGTGILALVGLASYRKRVKHQI